MVLQVRCPKAMFSSSCVYKGPYCTIQVRKSRFNGMELCHHPATPPQGHGRSAHGLHRGVTDIQPGLITSKMFDKVTCTQLFLAACHCSSSLRPAPEACY